MKKQIVLSIVSWATASTLFAASSNMVWEEVSHKFPQLMKNKNTLKHGVHKRMLKAKQNDYQLIAKKSQNSDHTRYQIYYKGIPVWGYELVVHKKKDANDIVTGTQVKGIEKDLKSLNAAYSEQDIENKILTKVNKSAQFKAIEKIIYIDKAQKAHLAYHLSFYVKDNTPHVKAPNYIVDANNGEVLKQWNSARSERIGQGLGGSSLPLPYRSGLFQHGDALPGLPSLGKFDVTVKEDRCYVETPEIKVMNLGNAKLGYKAFPIAVEVEKEFNLDAFSYPCDNTSLYLNYADHISGPVNYSFSPVNDTMYFAGKTLEMYKKRYGVDKPIGDDLPLRAYTHLGEIDNAFAIPTIRYKGRLIAHQQIVIGNGKQFLTAPAQSIIGHELSHNFTDINSGLIYEGQSGGINEAFSDMAAIALLDYIRSEYPWYWDGEDWSIGRESVIGRQPIRYLDEPSRDGQSIDHAGQYREHIDVHFSSGVFNKAFYLLAHKPGWSIQKAFQVMVDANRNYWSPISYFDFASCGVIQAAIDNKFDKTAVIEAFEEVGVHCPMHS